MKVATEEVSPVKKRLTVEIPESDVAAVYDEILREQRKAAKVPGFRPGKVPMDVVRKRLGESLHKEAAEHLMQRFGQAAIQQEGLNPIRGGVYMELGGEDEELAPAREGEPYTFTLAVEVMPEIDPEGYEGLKIARPKVEIEDEEIERELQGLRESKAEVEAVEGRATQTGDLVEVEIEGRENDGELDIPRETRTLKLGDENNLPAFERGLTGLEAGQSFSFDVDYPDDYPGENLAGKSISFRGDVTSIKEVRLPELNDELVKQVVEDCETLDDLKERIREALLARKNAEAEKVVRRRILDRLLDDTPFDPPETLVENEVKARLEDLGRRFAMQGIDPEKADLDWGKIIESQKEGAHKAVRETILLDRIAEKQSLDVGKDEIDQAVAAMARDMNADAAEVYKRLKSQGSLQTLKLQLLRSKALDWLQDKAHIV